MKRINRELGITEEVDGSDDGDQRESQISSKGVAFAAREVQGSPSECSSSEKMDVLDIN
jgi:hypothetical protein